MDADPPALLCAAFRRERSRNGKKLSELKSGLQKYIRRGEVDKALWCAGELFSFRDAPPDELPQRIVTNFRHRLMIIFLEDVGAFALWPRVDALLARWTGAPDRDAEALAVHEWTTVLCEAPKARVCSHARAVVSIRDAADPRAFSLACQMYPGIAALHAEFARDPRRPPLHEAQWKAALVEALLARSRVAAIWAWVIQEDGSPRAAPGGRKSVWTVFAALEEGCDPAVARMIPMARRWYKDLQNTREAFLCWMLPLLAQVDGHPLAPPDIPYAPPGVPFEDTGDRELDPYVYDIHVHGSGAAAKGNGGLVRFAEEGSLVENESHIVDPEWNAFYDDRKRLAEFVAPTGPPPPVAPGPVEAKAEPVADLPDDFIDGLLDDFEAPPPRAAPPPAAAPPAAAPPAADFADVTHETQFEFLVRAQINTGHGKTDVYFARAPGDPARVVVVKGPFASRVPPANAVEMNEWKRQNGLPHVQMAAVRMIPDRWPDGVPMGVRNRVTRDAPMWFLVADSLLPGDPPARAHGPTAKWPVTDVVDWAQLEGHVWAPMQAGCRPTRQEKIDYILAVLARFVIGIGDYADRNFLRANGRLYSLDEDPRSSKVWPHLYGELRKNKAAMVLGWLDEFGPEILAVTEAWVIPEDLDDAVVDRYHAVLDLGEIRKLFESGDADA
jgi:hypothetical protein